MRRLILLLVVTLSMACASSGGLASSDTFMQRYDDVWFAAIGAVDLMDGRIHSSNRGSGLILARLEMDALGSVLELDISVRRWMDGAEVRVSAREPGGAPADPQREQDLRQIEQDYLQFVKELAAQRSARRR
jgi:hypothetical protein